MALENRDPRSGDSLHWRTIIPSKGRKPQSPQEWACGWALNTHHKLAVDFLKNLLLIECHGLSFPLFDPLLL